MKKIILLSIAVFISGCADRKPINYQTVECVGLIKIQTIEKYQSFKLSRYNNDNNMYFGYGKVGLWQGGWVSPDMFDKIYCKDNSPIKK
ncbi:hypothetical protein ACVNW6_003136 [Proteus mirabilis]|nr:hypothetical protein [Proteus sp. G4417]NBM29609.1 hypothetical protein [Proteus sp. G4417]